jgi:hypothetical protein
MFIRDGGPSTVIKGTVGTGGVVKGDLCAVSSNTFVKAAANPTDATIIALALETAADTEVALFELVSCTRVVSAKYTGTSKTSLTDADITKAFDLTDSQTVNLDDTSGGPCLCVDYDNDLDLIHFVVVPVEKAV